MNVIINHIVFVILEITLVISSSVRDDSDEKGYFTCRLAQTKTED